MPLTAKGRKIMRAMKAKYGAEKGEQVFYASRNKGTITGVDPESSGGGKKKSESGPPIGEKATSQKQRAFLNARFGHAWVKRHHYDQPGELPEYAHGEKTTSPEVKAAFNKRKKKRKTEETTTSVNIGSQGTSTVPPRPRPRSRTPKLRSSFSSGLTKKKKPESIRAPRSYTGREMADARARVLQMVQEYETDRDRRRNYTSEAEHPNEPLGTVKGHKTTKQQQRLFGIARGMQKGETPEEYSPEAAEIAKGLSGKEVHKIASKPKSGYRKSP